MEHVYYLENPRTSVSAPSGSTTRTPRSRPGTPGQVIALPTLGAEVVVGDNARIEVVETSTRSRRVWQDRTRFAERMEEYKRLRTIAKKGSVDGGGSIVDLDGFDRDYGDSPNPLSMPSTPKQRVYVRPLETEKGLAAYFSMQGDWTAGSPLSGQASVSPRPFSPAGPVASLPRPNTVSGGIQEQESLLGPRTSLGNLSSEGSLLSLKSRSSQTRSPFTPPYEGPRPATTALMSRKYLKTPTHGRVKKDFQEFTRVRNSQTAPLDRMRRSNRRRARTGKPKSRRKKKRLGKFEKAAEDFVQFQMTLSAKPKRSLAQVKGRCAMCSMRRSKFSDFCDRCALKLRVSRADVVKASRKSWVRSGRAATFMLELAEDDIAITRLSFKEAKEAYRVVRDTRNVAKDDAGYETWEEALAHSNEAHHAAIKVQAIFRGFRFRARFRAGRRAIVRLQAWFHGAKGRVFARWHRHRWYNAISIQAIVRGFQAFHKVDVAGKRRATIVLQCAFRCYCARLTLQYKVQKEKERVAGISALVIQNAWRRKKAYIIVKRKRRLRDGATAMQKVFRMYKVREEFLWLKDCAVELQRHLRRWLAENEANRRRKANAERRKAILKIHNRAATEIQRLARVWLAIRLAGRKREVMDEAQEALDTAEERYDEVSVKGEWPTPGHYVEHAFMLMYDAASWNEAARMFRHGLGREPEDGQLLFAYSIMCQLRRNKGNNDLEEAERRKKEALSKDITRKGARRLEILFRCLIKMFPTNPLVLASYAVFHQFIRDHNTAAVYFQRAVKIDPYNNKIIGAYGQFEEDLTRTRAIVRGEKASAWFSEEDFRFEDMALQAEREIPHHTERRKVRLQARCYFLGENIMIKAKEVHREVSETMIELGLATRPTEEEVKALDEKTEEYRIFLTDKDVNIFVKVLDMKHLLLPNQRKALLHKIIDRLVFQELVITKQMALGIEFRQEPWIRCTHVTSDKWFLSVMASCIDRVAERLAKTELLQATKPFEGSDMDSDDDGGSRFGRKGKKKRKGKAGGKKKKKKKRSPFDVINVPAEMKGRTPEDKDEAYFQGDNVKGQSHEERLSAGRSIMFVAYIYKIKRSYRLTITGEQIRKLFVDQPLLVQKFLRPGWRLQAQPLVLRLVQMLELVATNETPRVYEKKMVLVDGKYVETQVDVTPDHEPTRRLVLSNLEKRMEEARLNIAATQIQKLCRGHLGRKYAQEYLPWSSALNIQRVWRGYVGRVFYKKLHYEETRRIKSTKIQAFVRRAKQRMSLAKYLVEKFPFSSGDWRKLWVAFSLQRKNCELSLRRANHFSDALKVKAALWFQTMSAPIDIKVATAFYSEASASQNRVSADYNFGYGIYLLRSQSSEQEAKRHFEIGFRLDPGGRAFQVTENSYFFRAASVRADEPEAQLNFAILLLYVRNNPTQAEAYLDETERLCKVEVKREEEMIADKRFEAEQAEVRIKEMAERKKNQTKKAKGSSEEEIPRVVVPQKDTKREKWRQDIMSVVYTARQRSQRFHRMVVPFQALVRGHFARGKHSPAVLHKISLYEHKLMPDNSRVVARLAFGYHAIKLDYRKAVGYYQDSMGIDDEDVSTMYGYGLALAGLAGLTDDIEKFKECEGLMQRAQQLDKGNMSYQWFEQEYFMPTYSEKWDPLRKYGVHVQSITDLVDAAMENKSAIDDSARKELRAKILCNKALIAQWLREDYGEANKLFIEASLLSPADKMIIGCYQYFFDQGLSVHLPISEVALANQLKSRLENSRETRAEREARLQRLEEERIVRVKLQSLNRDRSRRMGAFNRVQEAHERKAMFQEDHVLRGKLSNMERQRAGIVKSIGKSASEIAEERKRKRLEARANKKKAQAAKKKAAKKAGKKKGGSGDKKGKAVPMGKTKNFTLNG